MAGGRIDIEVGIDAASVPAQLQAGMQPALGMAKKMAGVIGVTLGGAALVGVGKQIISIGNDYTNSLNTMQAVSQATASQMAAVSERAKQLGNDIDLPNTSASDAAAAMTELAKGGFSVEQSMTAAKGTLQLAAAAQIDAASAAEIQSQTLQAFELDASNATRAADVLANVSNAASGEITDFAYGMAQSGTVAKGFGLSLEDSAATLGMLAKAGIMGSDAGTLLKTSLLALTDQGKPAQGAIEDLGLTIYNTEGKFVGMRSLLEQLKTAAGDMTEEQYQAATATLFGSDAMRLASIAAGNGVQAYDEMRTAVDRQGAAAEVAAAKTQGLPGALGKVQNSAETLALEVYDLVDGPLEKLATVGADKIAEFTPAIVGGLSTAGNIVADVGSTIAELPAPIQAAALAAVALKATGLGGFLSDLGSRGVANIRGFNDELRVQQSLAAMSGQQVGRLTSSIAVLETRVPVIASMGEAYRQAGAGLATFASRHRETSAGLQTLALRTKDSFAATDALGRAAGHSAAAGVATLGRTAAGVGAAGLSGLASAGSGLVSLMGGPLVLGFAGVTTAASAMATQAQTTAKFNDIYATSARNVANAQRDMTRAFDASRGTMNDGVLATVSAQIDMVNQKYRDLEANKPGFFDQVGANLASNTRIDRGAYDRNEQKERDSDDAAAYNDALEKLKLTTDDLAQALVGSDVEWQAFTGRLRDAGGLSTAGATELAQLRDNILQTQRAAADSTPGFQTLREAVKVLADGSADATDRLNAMKVALDIMSGKPVDAATGMQQFNQQVRDTAAATAEAWDKTSGWGQALKETDGSVNTQSANGDRLRTMLLDIKEATLIAAESGNDLAPVWAKNEEQFQQLAVATGLSVEEIRRMAEMAGYVPANIEILAQLRGADTVEQELTVVKALLAANANGVEIPATALTDEAKAQLEQVGVKIDEVNGKPGLVKITAPNKEALDQLQAIIDKVIPNKNVVVTTTHREIYDKTFLDGNGTGASVGNYYGEPKALGGPITGGIQGKDSVPILAMPGEHMLTTADVDRLGGQEGVYRFRAALAAGQVGKYANGGEIVDSMTSVVQSRFPGMQMSSGLRFTDNGHHSTGHAADFSNGYDSTPEMRSLASFIADNYLSQTLELIHSPFDRNIKNGAFVGDGMGLYGAGTMAQHRDHVHWAVNDPVGQPQAVVLGYAAGGKKEWTEKDDLDLRRAELAVEKARDDLNPKQDDKRTPRDFEDDRIQLRQAEIRVEELKKEKEAALRGSAPPPPAPALTATMSDQQIEKLEAGLAVSRAERERDEVYARAGVSAEEKQQADIDVMRARNRKTELDKPSGNVPSTWSDLFGQIAQEFVSSNVSDILGYYGASDDLGPLVNAGMAVAKAAPDGFGANGDQPAVELPSWVQDIIGPDGQVPAQVVPDWAKAFLQSLNIKVYDNGGPLDPFGLGLNLSGQREFVLNPRETAEMEATRAMFQSYRAVMRSQLEPPAEPQQSPRDPFDSARQPVFQLPNGFDPNAVASGIRKARQQEDFETAHVR